MEENVALDSKKQKQFVKSIKGIKKLLKGNDKPESAKEKEVVQDGKVTKQKRKQRGLVYLSHIPHGFYEHQMTEYFKQFGVVTNARVIRSKRTGMSKGHAFVEFKDTNVAQIVAETMNNYLMGKRLIKAAYLPPEKQRRFAMRKNWNAQNNPGNEFRQKMKKAHNSIKNDETELKIAKKLLSNLTNTKQKLRDLDIDYDFFSPVDIPESLVDQVAVKEEKSDKANKEGKKSKKLKKEKVAVDSESKTNKKEDSKKTNEVKVKTATSQKKEIEPPATKKSKKALQKAVAEQLDNKNLVSLTTKDNLQTKVKKEKKIKVEDKVKLTQEKKSMTKTETKVNKVQQEQKQQKLKNAGVKPPENFIKIQNESDDESDSDDDFDSDEYEKMMGQEDSDVNSGEGSDESGDDEENSDIEDESDDEEETMPPRKQRVSIKQSIQVQSKKQGKKQSANKPPPPQHINRKPQNASTSKKPKFEKKGNKKTLNKVIKKRK